MHARARVCVCVCVCCVHVVCVSVLMSTDISTPALVASGEGKVALDNLV